jgi:hypothetical protein
MRTRLIGLILALLAFPALASADDHRWDGYFGGSGGPGGSKLWGLHQAFAFVPVQDGMLSKLSVVVDWSTQFGTHDDGRRVTQFPLAFGGRVMLSRGKDKFKPWVHVLGASIYTNDGAADATDSAFVFGFGVDIVPKTDVKNTFGLRVQYDYFNRSSTEREDFWRVSAGAIYRFGQHQ